MILHTGLRRQEYSRHLEELIQSQKLSSGDGGTPEQWANESLRSTAEAWVPDGANLDEKYFQKEIKVVDRQMALAGLRLAKLLNDTIGKMTPREFASTGQQNVPAQTSLVPPIQAGGDASSVKVWVNPRSMVYHCPAHNGMGKPRMVSTWLRPKPDERDTTRLAARIIDNLRSQTHDTHCGKQ